MKKSFILTLYCLASTAVVYAQPFTASELTVIKPLQIITDQYTCVTLSKQVTDDPMANRFDINNPYSYLQVVNDTKGKSYHIIYQTNFDGKILYLGYSNNLSGIFNKKDKPLFLFLLCIKEMNEQVSSVQVAGAAVKCMIDRLNYCSGFN